MSSFIGRAFKSVESNLLKTILGGLAFIAVKGTIKIILKHSEYVRKRHKKILDYNESNVSEFMNNLANRSRSSVSLTDSITSMDYLVLENVLEF